ncbi:MAG: hypothetical protein V7785_24345 [Bermanella sp.]
MNTNTLLAISVLFIVVISANHFVIPLIIQTDNEYNSQPANLMVKPSTLVGIDSNTAITSSVEVNLTELNLTEEKTIELHPEAISSLEQARLNGDPRSPPIHHSELSQRANKQQLEDSDQYSSYQANKKKQLISHYLQAAQPKINKLKEQVQIAKEKGLPPEQLAEGEEKIKRLEDMVEQLKQQYPDALSDKTSI